MTVKISKDMTFNEILEMYPQAADILHRFNLECDGCLGAATESLADGARAHGLKVDEVLAALNQALDE